MLSTPAHAGLNVARALSCLRFAWEVLLIRLMRLLGICAAYYRDRAEELQALRR